MPRPWIKTERREPPKSTDKARFWLELYIPERVEASPIKDKAKGLAMGVYLGSGSFRLIGQQTATLEHVTAWRPLAGNPHAVNQRVQLHHAATR